MAITKIDSIYLYTNLTWAEDEVSDSVEAKKYLEDNGVQFIHLNYADPVQHEAALAPLRTWLFADGQHEEITEFPLVIYSEVHDDLETAFYPKVLLYGLDAIKDSTLTDLYQLGR
jgi:hypothetical protein